MATPGCCVRTKIGEPAMLTVRMCPQCGAVCSTSGAQCAACGQEANAPHDTDGNVMHTSPEHRVGPASRGIWQMIVDALFHGCRPAFLGRRAERPAADVQRVMQEHVVQPMRVVKDAADERAKERRVG